MLLVAVLYAIAPFIVASRLNEVPSLGTITLALGAVGLGYAPIALLTSPQPPAPNSVISLALLTVLCTAVAFIVFFALIGEVGPVRAPLFTYMNPVVAVALGALILSEPLTPALLLGFPVVIVGCLLAAGGLPIGDRRRADVPILSEPDPTSPRSSS